MLSINAAGALLGGWLGAPQGLRWALGFAGGVSVLLVLVVLLMLVVLVAWRLPLVRELKVLPQPERDSEWLGHEAEVRRM